MEILYLAVLNVLHLFVIKVTSHDELPWFQRFIFIILMMNVRFSLLNMAQLILGVTLPNF